MNKSTLRQAILDHLQADLATQIKAAATARDEATNEESRARSKYDTHSQEAAYLAEGQARIAREIEESLELYASLPIPQFTADAPIALGAIVDLEANGRRVSYFLGPRSGGLELDWEGRKLLVVTPSSPLGRQLVGRRVGEEIEAPGRGGRPQTQRIVAVL